MVTIPITQYEWIHEGCEQRYREAMEMIELIQAEARRQMQPYIKIASNMHAIGTRPVIEMVEVGVLPK